VISQRLLAKLLAGVLLLPIAIVLAVAVATLLSAMQDTAGAYILNRIALGLGLVWSLSLISLLLALAVNSITEGRLGEGPYVENSIDDSTLAHRQEPPEIE
jgi:hypothetical protein